jgi:DNA primase
LITRDTIENIVSTARIEEVIGDFVSLKRRGVNLIGLCPFHNEKTPSFTVSPVKGIYKCFGCGKAGNAVNFIMEHEHFNYPEALRYLARKYGIGIEEEEQTPEMLQEQGEKESLFNLNQFAQQYFTHSLFETEEGKAVGLSYFRERGLRDDIIRKFQLGYSPDPWDSLSQHALKEGYKREFLLKSGLSLEKENRIYDRFHSRVIFPIHSASGRVTGFGGRILTSDKNRPKYVNSPESEIYNKSRSLYGIYFARNEIVAKDNCFLVEGYTDVISMHQAGIANVVASSGTSLTHDQVRLIQRYTRNITILYDGDPAGIKASMRGIDMIVEGGMNVKIVLFPEGDDPDSYARKHHPDEVEAFIRTNSVNFILFKTKLLLDETKGDPIKKAALVREIVQTISLIPDGITRSLYIRECSNMMNVGEQVLVNETNKMLRTRIAKAVTDTGNPEDAGLVSEEYKAPPQAEYDAETDEYQEAEIMRLLLTHGTKTMTLSTLNEDKTLESHEVLVAKYLIFDIFSDEIFFDNPVYSKVFDEYRRLLENGETPGQEHFLNHPDREISNTAIYFILGKYELSPNWEKNNITVKTEDNRLGTINTKGLLTFKVKKLDKRKREIARKMRASDDIDETLNLQREYFDLDKISKYIHHTLLGRDVVG